jgi:hypothetical protein
LLKRPWVKLEAVSLYTEQLKKSIDDMIGDEVYRSEKDTFVAHLLPWTKEQRT